MEMHNQLFYIRKQTHFWVENPLSVRNLKGPRMVASESILQPFTVCFCISGTLPCWPGNYTYNGLYSPATLTLHYFTWLNVAIQDFLWLNMTYYECRWLDVNICGCALIGRLSCHSHERSLCVVDWRDFMFLAELSTGCRRKSNFWFY